MRSFDASLVVLILAAVSAAGCGVQATTGSGAGTVAAGKLTAALAVDAQGNCTSSFVNAYNAVITQATLAQTALNSSGPLTPAQATAKLQNLLSACARLFGNALPTCKAILAQQSAPVSSDLLSTTCQLATSLATGGTAPSGASSAPPPPLAPPGGTLPIVTGGGSGSGPALPSAPSGASALSRVSFPLSTSISLIPAAPTVALITAFGNGVCSPAFATAYANLRSQLAAAAGQTQSATGLQSIRTSCQLFFGSLAGPVTCSANLTGSVEVISSSTLQSACSAF